MTKFKFRQTLAALAIAAAIPAARSEVFLNEDFSSYSTGNLYNQGSWVHHSTQTEQNDPVQVVAHPMAYDGFAQATQAASVTKANTTYQEKLKKQFREKSESTEPLYMAALLNLTEVPSAAQATYFLSFITSNANTDTGLIDGKGGDEYCRLFAYESPDDATKYRFGTSKYAAAMKDKLETRDFTPGTPVLVVIKWEWTDGTTNDVCKVWINPARSDFEPATADISDNSGADPVVGTAKKPLQGIEIRQGGSSSKATPSGFIGPIRVASSWAELWQGSGPGPVTQTTLKADKSKVEFTPVYQGSGDLTATLLIKGENLTGPVTVTCPSPITASALSISQEDVTATAGYTLTLTCPTAQPLSLSDNITLSADGVADLKIPVTATVVGVVEKADLSDLNNLPETDTSIYRYTGTATVTWVDDANNIIYAQDATGGIKISLENYYGQQTLSRGDQFTGMVCAYDGYAYGGGAVFPADMLIGTVTATGVEAEPMAISLAELAENPRACMSRVVKIPDLTFTAYTEGAKIGTAQTPVTSGTATGAVRAFPGSTALNTTMPQHAVSLTGIATSATAPVISLRDAGAIELDPPAVEFEAQKSYDDDYQAIGTEAAHTTYTVKAVNLPKPMQIWLGGAGRTHFSLDVEEIPAGTSTTTVTVTYAPTAVGKHSAMVNFDATPAELSESFSISAKAWDPANPPTVIVADDTLLPFEAKVGETHQQTLAYTSANLLDWGSVKVENNQGAAFRINTTTLLKTGGAELTVTFAPQSEGDFNASLVFSTDKMDSFTINLTGTATGEPKPEERQGDELAFDLSNPRPCLVEDFENCGTHNQPLAIDAWKNVAGTGTRAWWAYTFDDTGNTAAKVTPYDSKAQQDTECEMLLLSPALDYANAPTHLLTFSLMGDFLNSDPDDTLEVCYIDYLDNEPYIEPLGGLNIPTQADYNGEWIPYVIDLEGQELADTFFIGFLYTGTRGTGHSATYYIDDFSWGDTSVPYIRTGVDSHHFTCEQDSPYESEEIIIRPHGLTSDITLTLGGTHAANFSVTPSALPPHGGAVKVGFLSSEVALHEATLTVASPGAPSKVISLQADNKVSSAQAIEGVMLKADVYTPDGLCVGRQMTRPQILKTLPKGIYIFNGRKIAVR